MEEKSFDYMNVIPLVDVMMVLLVIVLMTSTFIASGMIPVDLPKAAQDARQAGQTLTIVIDGSGVIYLEGKPTTLSGLDQAVREVGDQTKVLVRADRHLRIQACVDVLDILNRRGLTKVALQTEHQF
ncbi:MAG: biopolymer transporter ExbD [Smithellaceae bacterium]